MSHPGFDHHLLEPGRSRYACDLSNDLLASCPCVSFPQKVADFAGSRLGIEDAYEAISRIHRVWEELIECCGILVRTVWEPISKRLATYVDVEAKHTLAIEFGGVVPRLIALDQCDKRKLRPATEKKTSPTTPRERRCPLRQLW